MTRRLLSTKVLVSTVLVRLLVGSVFLLEGIQKFLYPVELAAGRFTKIGIPAPEIMGPFVGGCEIVCGALLIIGLLTRLAAVVLLIDISVAQLSQRKFRSFSAMVYVVSGSPKDPWLWFLEHNARVEHPVFPR